eukprot:s2229_g13.t1
MTGRALTGFGAGKWLSWEWQREFAHGAGGHNYKSAQRQLRAAWARLPKLQALALAFSLVGSVVPQVQPPDVKLPHDARAPASTIAAEASKQEGFSQDKLPAKVGLRKTYGRAQ